MQRTLPAYPHDASGIDGLEPRALSNLRSIRNARRKLKGGHICGGLPDIPSNDKYDLLTMRFTACGYWLFMTAKPVQLA